MGEVRKFISNNKVSVMALLETKVKSRNSSRLMKKFGTVWSWQITMGSLLGAGFGLGWQCSDITLQALHTTEYLIHCLIQFKKLILQWCMVCTLLKQGDQRGDIWKLLLLL